MRNLKKAEETATQRAMLLAPLLCDGLDRAMMNVLRKRICEETGLSEGPSVGTSRTTGKRASRG